MKIKMLTRIIKTFSIKMKEDVGMSKPKKHANNNISTFTTIKQNTKHCTYVGLYGSGLFNFRSYINLPTLFACFLGFDIPTSSFIFIENVFIILVFF